MTLPLLDDSSSTASEILVVLNPTLDSSEFRGTRAMLEAEGFEPEEWPEGFEAFRWDDQQFVYCLRRLRPKGAKGPQKQFLDVDWWYISRRPLNGLSFGDRMILLKKKELEAAVYRESPEGRAAFMRSWNLFCAAERDTAFQAFKAAIGLDAKRGRKGVQA